MSFFMRIGITEASQKVDIRDGFSISPSLGSGATEESQIM